MVLKLFEAPDWLLLVVGLVVFTSVAFVFLWLRQKIKLNPPSPPPNHPTELENKEQRIMSRLSNQFWPIFQGNPSRTGEATEVLAPPLRKVWEFKPAGYIKSSPAVSEGRLFFGTADRGTNRGIFYALDAASGQVLWLYETDGMIYSSPAVSQGIVYFGSTDKNFYAIDAETGKLVWKVRSTSTDANNPFSGLFFSNPIVINGMVCISDEFFYLLDAKTGTEIIKLGVGEWTGSNPAFHNGVLYAGLYRSVNAYDLQNDGRSLWKVMPGGRITSGPAIADGLVFVGTSRQTLHALDAKTGQQVWEFMIESDPLHSLPGIQSSPAISQGKVFFGAPDAKIYALASKTGKKIWSFKTSDYISSSPIVSGSTVYIVSEDGIFLALDIKNGKPQWKFNCQGNESASPVISNGMLYLGSDRMYAFSK